MFIENARVEQTNEGLRFYEKDIIYDNYKYSGEPNIKLKAQYISPGIGIVFNDENNNNKIIMKIGLNEFSIYFLSNGIQKLLTRNSISIIPETQEIDMYFNIDNKTLYFYIDDYLCCKYKLKKFFKLYTIGIYSNKGNIIKDFKVSSNIPDNYTLNIQNTNNSHIYFFKNGFTMLNSDENIEFQQDDILLEPGIYYLKYTKENINNYNDIKSYILLGDKNKYYDDNKNILIDNMFVLDKKQYIALKFKGKNGIIKNIQITNDKNDSYISTSKRNIINTGSSLKIDMDEIKKIEWNGTIYKLPTNHLNYIIKINNKTFGFYELNLDFNKEYKFIYDKEYINIYDNDILIYSNKIQLNNNYIEIFFNIDAKITYLMLYKYNNEAFNILEKYNQIISIPETITGPIVVTDEKMNPFDLSSSYRYITSKDEYVFTNIEREIFKSAEKIILEKDILKKQGSIKIFAIKDKEIDMSKIYNCKNEKIFDIDCIANKYDILYEKDLYYIDKNKKEIFLKNYDEYEYIIVDYYKENSYSINYSYESKCYLLEVSSSINNKYKIKYDVMKNNEIKSYSILNNISLNDLNSYIVLNINNEEGE